MKKLLAVFCCVISIQFASAQSIQTAAVNDVDKAILPTYDNLIKILRMPGSTFLTTMANFNYIRHTPNENEYRAQNSDEIYSVTKDDKQVDIFFSADTKYPQATKDDFTARFPGARHRLMDNGVEAYYFDLQDGSETLHYCILFDITKEGGGGVTLLEVD
ncbi:MAG: hypothetical protein ABI166_05440 [Mucilaginibacter sp.]